MIAGKVKKTMTNALDNFSKAEDVKPNEIQFFINAKEDGTPYYFYAKKGVPVKETVPTEDGKEETKVRELSFNEILGKKFDILQQGVMVSQFMTQQIKAYSRKYECSVKDVYVMITSADEKNSELMIVLYKGSKPQEQVTLERLFGDED